jgi:hypothetical protein
MRYVPYYPYYPCIRYSYFFDLPSLYFTLQFYSIVFMLVVIYIHCTLQDYVSVWQIRDALERSRIVPVFTISFDLRCVDNDCTNTIQRLTEPYADLLKEFDIPGQFRIFNSSSVVASSAITQELINLIQEAYSVSMAMHNNNCTIGIRRVHAQ